MAVEITLALRAALEQDGLNADDFIQDFTEWKADCAAGREDDSYWFGRDGAYRTPKVGTKQYALRHVHLVPITDPEALSKWNFMWEKRRNRTSDRVLVYSKDARSNFLLIFILPEGDAHWIADNDPGTMEGFASTAEAFLDGSIIA